jgi:hypothetical protein
MTITFGSKEFFAIDYHINDHKSMMGNVRIWIHNIYVGYFDEEVPLLTVQYSLDNLSKRLDQLTDPNLKQAKNEGKDLFKVILSLSENGKFMVTLGESFDDFSVFVFKDGSFLQFLWKFCENPFFKYPNYPEGQHTAIIDATYFKTVVEQAQIFIQNKANLTRISHINQTNG